MTPTASFNRTSLTFLNYALMGWYAYLQSSINPSMPFIRQELNLSFGIAALHLSAFAFGMMLAGLLGDRLGARFGTHRVFWLGGAGMTLGAILFIMGAHPILTIGGVLLMGTAGSMLWVMIQSTLIYSHPEHSAVAVTEANTLASVGAILVPIAVGLSQSAGVGWRVAIIIPIVFWLSVLVIGRNVSFPLIKRKNEDDERNAPLNLTFWLYAVVLFLGVAIEWCMLLWGADYFIQQASVDPSLAATLVTFFSIGAVIGRLVVSRLLLTIAPRNMLMWVWVLVALGFPLFWLSQFAPLNILGFLIVGLGAGSFFPIGLNAALDAVPNQKTQANARAYFVVGTAVLLMPFMLGVLADAVGLQQAYALVIVLTALATVLTIIANRRLAGTQKASS
jgi:MFS family permease